jgi:hypothetical protein
MKIRLSDGESGQGRDCDVPPLSKDGKSKIGLLRGVIIEVMMHNTSHTRIKHMNALKFKLYYNLSLQFDYRVLSERLKIKYICGSGHSSIKNDTLP